MKFTYLIIALYAVLSVGCYTPKSSERPAIRPDPVSDYLYFFSDEPLAHRIKVTFISRSEREICVGRQQWPNSAGDILDFSGNDGIYLIVDADKYPLKEVDYNTGYCGEKSCYNPLLKGQHASAYISYSHFDLPVEKYSSVKDLKYAPQPFWCDKGKFFK